MCEQLLQIKFRCFLLNRRLELPFNNTHIWIGIESSFKLLRIDLTLLINDMSIDLGDHRGLCVTGITLSGFNITMIDFKFVSRAGVSQ